MWDATSPFARRARVTAGALVLSAAAILPFLSGADASPTKVLAHATESISFALRGELDGFHEVKVNGELPEGLNDTLIYIERDSGEGMIYGRLRVVDGKLWASLPELEKGFGELRWAPPVRNLGNGMSLVLGAEGLSQEVDTLKEDLLPTAQEELLEPIAEKVRIEFDRLIEETIESESSEFEVIVAKLGEELAPEVESLSNTLVETALEKVGVWGVAEGLWRKGSSALGTGTKKAWNAVKGLFGGDSEEVDDDAPDFLSDERKKELRLAIQKDIRNFWSTEGEKIMLKGREIVGTRNELMKRIESKFTARLGGVVLETLEAKAYTLEPVLIRYFNNLGQRKLVTKSGTPRLAMAYAIRSGSGLTDRPLVVYIPPKGEGKSSLSLQALESAGSE